MAAFPLKRKRLSQIVGKKYVTDSALSSILASLRDSGDLALGTVGTSRRTLKKHVERDVLESTVYGPAVQQLQLPLITGGDFEWDVPHPAAMLNLLADTPAFGLLLDKTFEIHPPTAACPWRIIYYADECTAGNMLVVDPSRKSWCIYFSFAEFGVEALCHVDAWIIGGVIRTKNVSRILGGFGTVFRHHLELFVGRLCDFRKGVTVHYANGVRVIVAKLEITIGDVPALKAMWGFKGAGGMRPCGSCLNIVTRRAGFDLPVAGMLKDIKCTRTDEFVFHSNETIWDIADRVARPMTKSARHNMQIRLGIVYNPHGVLHCAHLRSGAPPADCVFWDFMHCFFTNGTVALELQLFMDRCKEEHVLSAAMVSAFLKQMRWPRNNKSPPSNLCSEVHDASCDKYFKGGASQLLSFYPVFREIVRRVIPVHIMALQVRSLLALFHVLDGYNVIQRGRVPLHWREACEDWYQCFQRAYPDIEPKPKHHLCLHMDLQRAKHNMFPTCFVHERRHKTYKNFARATTIHAGFEKSLTISLINDHIRNLSDKDCLRTGTFHRDPRAASAECCCALGVDSASVALSGVCKGIDTSVGDMVFVSKPNERPFVAEVLLHVRTAGDAEFFVLIAPFAEVATGTWDQRGAALLVRIEDVVGATPWAPSEHGRRVIKIPSMEYECTS